MCVSVLLNLLWLLPVTLLDTISAEDTTMSPLCPPLSPHSHSAPVLPSLGHSRAGVGRYPASPVLNCSDADRLVAVKVQLHSNRHTARGKKVVHQPPGLVSFCLSVCLGGGGGGWGMLSSSSFIIKGLSLITNKFNTKTKI